MKWFAEVLELREILSNGSLDDKPASRARAQKRLDRLMVRRAYKEDTLRIRPIPHIEFIAEHWWGINPKLYTRKVDLVYAILDAQEMAR